MESKTYPGEPNYHVGMEVAILEHKKPTGKGYLSFKGEVLSLRDNLPYQIICLDPKCNSTKVMLDYTLKIAP